MGNWSCRIVAPNDTSSEAQGQLVGVGKSLNEREKIWAKKSQERKELPLGLRECKRHVLTKLKLNATEDGSGENSYFIQEHKDFSKIEVLQVRTGCSFKLSNVQIFQCGWHFSRQNWSSHTIPDGTMAHVKKLFHEIFFLFSTAFSSGNLLPFEAIFDN